ncbi:MAG: DUF5658 family protein [Vicinamibacterales bacterium]
MSVPVAAQDSAIPPLLPQVERLFPHSVSFTAVPEPAKPAGVEPADLSRAALATDSAPVAGADDQGRYPAPIAPRDGHAPGSRQSPRFPVLGSMYASFVALQAADVLSTSRALERGGREMNPILPFASNKAAMFAVKAASATLTIYLSEKIARRNRVAAIVMMAAINSAYTAIVAHNYRVARGR